VRPQRRELRMQAMPILRSASAHTAIRTALQRAGPR
jgi:hypothetical protein